jgi:sirohydrochlorin cobaltochelatase
MWTTFCDLALHGGPPHRGAAQALRGREGAAPAAAAPPEILAELERGIRETTGLDAEPAGPGWIAIPCESRSMAAWLCAAIVLENVDARVEGTRLLLPAGPDFRVEDQVKSVITVVAKTHHYWREHLAAGRRE